MHSKVIQLDTGDDGFIVTPSDLKRIGFVDGTHVDGVREEPEFELAIEALVSKYGKNGVTYENGCLIFEEGFRRDYFIDKLSKIREVVDSTSVEEFMDCPPYELTHSGVNRYGYKVFTPKNEVTDFDDFVRYELKEGKSYEVLEVIDYHY